MNDSVPILILGPCVIESPEHAATMAKEIRGICSSKGVPFIFKASFDKANRTSIESFRGPGLAKGLGILQGIKKTLGIPVTSDIHEARQADLAASVLDVIQIPAMLSRQTDLLVAARETRKTINIKKGQSLSPYDVKHVIDKVRISENSKVMVTERGTTFGYNNLVVDFRSIPIIQSFDVPVIFDASHSVQKPGAMGGKSDGDPRMIPVLARAAIAAGADGLFVEVHDNPAEALSDGPNSLPLEDLSEFLDEILDVWKAVRR
jgi:2-dehydro-3-deoxyphosphooctonate aldolase (KDO 8-P synthase)